MLSDGRREGLRLALSRSLSEPGQPLFGQRLNIPGYSGALSPNSGVGSGTDETGVVGTVAGAASAQVAVTSVGVVGEGSVVGAEGRPGTLNIDPVVPRLPVFSVASASMPASPCSDSVAMHRSLLIRRVKLLDPAEVARRVTRAYKPRPFVMLDLRPFFHYNLRHVRSAINLNCSDRFNRKRLQLRRATVVDLAAPSVREHLKRRSCRDVIVYDETTSSIANLAADHPVYLVLSAILEDNREPLLMSGGFSAFQNAYPELCDDALRKNNNNNSSSSSSNSNNNSNNNLDAFMPYSNSNNTNNMDAFMPYNNTDDTFMSYNNNNSANTNDNNNINDNINNNNNNSSNVLVAAGGSLSACPTEGGGRSGGGSRSPSNFPTVEESEEDEGEGGVSGGGVSGGGIIGEGGGGIGGGLPSYPRERGRARSPNYPTSCPSSPSEWAPRSPGGAADPCSSEAAIEGAPATQVLPHLFLGNARDAQDLSLLQTLGVTRVLNVTSRASVEHAQAGVVCKTLPALDNAHQNLRQYFPEAIAFIDCCKYSGERVLVHCQAGISRSATIVIAYLMHATHQPMIEAYKTVKSLRAIISPNLNFMGQLVEWETALRTDIADAECTPCHQCQWKIQEPLQMATACQL